MLHGDVRSYIISPLSSIVDERYTVRNVPLVPLST